MHMKMCEWFLWKSFSVFVCRVNIESDVHKCGNTRIITKNPRDSNDPYHDIDYITIVR